MDENTFNQTTTEVGILAEIKRGIALPPLLIKLKQALSKQSRFPDCVIVAEWDGKPFEFVAEIKSRSNPRAFSDAILQAKRYAEELRKSPMIVLPYLRTKQLDELVAQGVSGVDLCGNGAVIVRHELLVYRTGSPNRFREPIRTRFAYRGATSLVPRVFLCRRQFTSLADIDGEIRRRGGRIALSTISKALARMQDDVLIEKLPGKIQLLQPDGLLARLASDFRPPTVHYRIALATKQPLDRLASRCPSGAKLVLAGRASLKEYAVAGRDEPPILYSDDVRSILGAWSESVRETQRFADVELWETDDPTPFFDVRRKHGIPCASPIQAYLECAVGEKRDKDAAAQIRQFILDGIGRQNN
ncbi:MAG: hypothetical protein HYS13_09650 [Planctomycetia bacterium]|nr:hypothetical protein [Planctomycetia bacterium]